MRTKQIELKNGKKYEVEVVSGRADIKWGKVRIKCPWCNADYREDYWREDRITKGLCCPPHEGTCTPKRLHGERFWTIHNLEHREIDGGDYVVCPFANRWTMLQTVRGRMTLHNKGELKSFTGKTSIPPNEPWLTSSATIALFNDGKYDELVEILDSLPDDCGMPAVRNRFGMSNKRPDLIREFLDNFEILVGPKYFQRFVFTGQKGGTPSRKAMNNDFSERELKRRFDILDSLPNGCGWDTIYGYFSRKDKGWIMKHYNDIFRLIPELLDKPIQWHKLEATLKAGNIPEEYLR